MDLWSYLIGFVLFFFAAFTKGMLGFGVNIVSIPIMSLLVGPKAAVAITSLPSILNNLILIIQRRDHDSFYLLKRVKWVLAFGFVGISLGSILLVSLNTDIIAAFLGLLTIIFVLTDRLRRDWQIPPEKEGVMAPISGFVAGLLGGVSGITAPELVAYLDSLRLNKRQFVYAISLIFILFTVAQSLNLWLYGVYTLQTALLALSYIVPLILGTLAGTKMQDNISQKLFERLLLGTLFLVGLDLIRRGLHLF